MVPCAVQRVGQDFAVESTGVQQKMLNNRAIKLYFGLSFGRIMIMKQTKAKKIHVVGMSAHHSSLASREKVLQAFNSLPNKSDFCNTLGIQSIIPIVTCNRIEWFILAHQADPFIKWVRQSLGDDHHYLHQGQAALSHLLRVACGLDSLIIGESPILGQLKKASAEAKAAGFPVKGLDSLLQTICAKAKVVRHQSGLNQQGYSLINAVIHATSQVFMDISRQRVLIVGGGEIAQMCLQRFLRLGVKEICVINRSLQKQKLLAEKYPIMIDEFANLSQRCQAADIIICATTAHQLLIKATDFGGAKDLKAVIDLSMPRNVAIDVGEIPGLFLFDIDHIGRIHSSIKKLRSHVLDGATGMIDKMVVEVYRSWLVQVNAQAIIALREEMRVIKENSVAQVAASVAKGEPLSEVLDASLDRLLNQLMHKPTQIIRHAASSDNERLLAEINAIIGVGEE